MKQVIRRNIFETNSSSMHSLSISNKDNIAQPSILQGEFGEFGWGYESYSNVSGRLSYLLTAIASWEDLTYSNREGQSSEIQNKFLNSKYFKLTNEVVKDFVGKDIEFDWENILRESSWNFYPFGYIDHQSMDSYYDKGIEKYIPDVLYDCGLTSLSNDEEFKSIVKDFIFNNKYEIIIDNDNH